MSIEFLPALTTDQLDSIEALAHEIWHEYYTPLIGRAQVEYMLARFQSTPAMENQVREGYEYFLVQRGQCNIGYVAVQPQPAGLLFISKLYLHVGARGSGTGRACIEFIEGLARERGLGGLWLTVNKGNPTVEIYERLGFTITGPVVMNIGGGFVMDDFRMEKPIAPLD